EWEGRAVRPVKDGVPVVEEGIAAAPDAFGKHEALFERLQRRAKRVVVARLLPPPASRFAVQFVEPIVERHDSPFSFGARGAPSTVRSPPTALRRITGIGT